MAKYSREQRDRAVDLYIKYEHSAADTIRELGYPSRGALWMWYKDRLEEERTGIPSGRDRDHRLPLQFLGNRAVPQLASAGRQLVDPRGEQLMAFRIAERAHGAFQTPAVSEVMVHGGLFLLVRVPPVPFPASGLSSGAFLLEAFPVPHRQHPPAGIAELVYHVRGAALVFDVQVHGPVTLLLAVLHHKGVLLPVGESKKTSPPRIKEKQVAIVDRDGIVE